MLATCAHRGLSALSRNETPWANDRESKRDRKGEKNVTRARGHAQDFGRRCSNSSELIKIGARTGSAVHICAKTTVVVHIVLLLFVRICADATAAVRRCAPGCVYLLIQGWRYQDLLIQIVIGQNCIEFQLTNRFGILPTIFAEGYPSESVVFKRRIDLQNAGTACVPIVSIHNNAETAVQRIEDAPFLLIIGLENNYI